MLKVLFSKQLALGALVELTVNLVAEVEALVEVAITLEVVVVVDNFIVLILCLKCISEKHFWITKSDPSKTCLPFSDLFLFVYKIWL